MKGLVIRYFAIFIIALIGFYLALRLFQGFVSKSETLRCRFSSCNNIPDFKTVQIPGGNLGNIAVDLMKYSYACWLESGKGSAGRDIWCFEVYIQNIDGYYSKSEFMDVLKNREDIPTSYLDYEVPMIQGESMSVFVMYNATSRKVVVR